jgi:hypothetical protein
MSGGTRGLHVTAPLSRLLEPSSFLLRLVAAVTRSARRNDGWWPKERPSWGSVVRVSQRSTYREQTWAENAQRELKVTERMLSPLMLEVFHGQHESSGDCRRKDSEQSLNGCGETT